MTQEINIDKLNLRELNELGLKIELRRQQIEEDEKNMFLDKMKKEAAQLGLNFETLMGGKIRKPRKKVAPKFENPDFDPDTDPAKSQFWTGVGRNPKWVTKYLETHKNLDDCLIDKSKATGEAANEQDKATNKEAPHKGQAPKPHDKQHKIKAV